MAERVRITEQLRGVVKDYLGYDLIKPTAVGRYISAGEPDGFITVDQFNSPFAHTLVWLNQWGQISNWIIPKTRKDKFQPTVPNVTTETVVPSRKAKILMAALFPDEITDERFKMDHAEEIRELRQKLLP